MLQNAKIEARLLLDTFSRGLPQTIDGREAITQMKQKGAKNWKQTEWIGFYPEYWFENHAAAQVGATRGPRLGKVIFDIKRDFVWDLKAHSEVAGAWSPLNDVEAVEGCIKKHGGVGFLVLSGQCEYDDDSQAFKRWHDALKGKKTDYRNKLEARNAPSRKRKVSFSPAHLVAFRFESMQELQRAQLEGWIKGFQQGMRNSNDTARRAKIQVDVSSIPDWANAAEVSR